MTTKSLPRLLLGVALLGASSLGLAAGGAKAATVCTFQVCAPGSTATVLNQTVTTINGPTAGTGDVELSSYFGPQESFQVDTDFNTPPGGGPLVGAPGGTTGTFDYQITTGFLGPVFHTATLSWAGTDNGNGAPSVTKEIYKNAGWNPADLVATLTGNNSVLEPNSSVDLLALGYNGMNMPFLNNLWIRDTYNVPENSTLDNFQNTFTQGVPGPLPLLGAGTAFGFSRRLRRRCAKARLNRG